MAESLRTRWLLLQELKGTEFPSEAFKLGRVLLQGARLHVERLFVSDNEAVVELRSLATAKNRMRFDNYYCWVVYCWVVYFRDEVIVKVRPYLDSVMVAILFGENPIAV